MNQRDHTICEVCDSNKATHIRRTVRPRGKLTKTADCLCGECAANPAPDQFVRPMWPDELVVLADTRPVVRPLHFFGQMQGAT